MRSLCTMPKVSSSWAAVQMAPFTTVGASIVPIPSQALVALPSLNWNLGERATETFITSFSRSTSQRTMCVPSLYSYSALVSASTISCRLAARSMKQRTSPNPQVSFFCSTPSLIFEPAQVFCKAHCRSLPAASRLTRMPQRFFSHASSLSFSPLSSSNAKALPAANPPAPRASATAADSQPAHVARRMKAPNIDHPCHPHRARIASRSPDGRTFLRGNPGTSMSGCVSNAFLHMEGDFGPRRLQKRPAAASDALDLGGAAQLAGGSRAKHRRAGRLVGSRSVPRRRAGGGGLQVAQRLALLAELLDGGGGGPGAQCVVLSAQFEDMRVRARGRRSIGPDIERVLPEQRLRLLELAGVAQL